MAWIINKDSKTLTDLYKMAGTKNSVGFMPPGYLGDAGQPAEVERKEKGSTCGHPDYWSDQ